MQTDVNIKYGCELLRHSAQPHTIAEALTRLQLCRALKSSSGARGRCLRDDNPPRVPQHIDRRGKFIRERVNWNRYNYV